ncbi:2-oxoglutarate dehydrogenase, E2 component, dihydrolipoamide succinyltransferase [Melioribacteraceae bacterium 4301-Me]|uniref:2-oxoglutarate dehydrogenase, E2 component, dihydrolipoamide succinyltransferase n=1 Tax=Pyranulibacter aquaticus TaxID=3163344 RepID=UPI00359BD6E9
MKVEVVMPKMGESINEGTIIKWHKKKGEKVKKDEILFEISTDKVDTEIPSPEDGVLAEIKVFEQETAEVGTVVAIIETDSENIMVKDEPKPKITVEEIPSTTQVGGELIDIVMPKMGESVMEGTVIKWHKKVGDKVKKDEILFEISTDKVDTEVPSPLEGTLTEILVGENETAEVGAVVARLTTSSGIVKQQKKEKLTESETLTTHQRVEKQVAKPTEEKVEVNRFYSPLVLNIAKSEGIELNELDKITGTGIGGRVTKKDILSYIENKKQSKGKVVVTQKEEKTLIEEAQQAKMPTETGVEIIPMDNLRQRIMYHMVNSRDTSVHVTAVIEVDMTKIHNYILQNRDSFNEKEGIKLTYMPFISYAVIKGLKEYPYLNASIDGNNIVLKKFINLGIAVAVEPNGLIVPNIKRADEKNIRGLAKAIAELGFKARNKKLLPEDIMDGTFTITNYGVFGSLFGTPIINQPEVGILGVGAVTKKAVVVEINGLETIAIKPMMYLSLSHDHRLIDGMLGGKFLKLIKDTLENFDTDII